uniref:Uncharacterized protein n=1 Tax=Chrysotila carterae TaxID=13221 RepID=A0A7S4BWL9_CHRCT
MAEKFEDVLKRYEALRSQVAALQRSHEEAIGRAKSAEGALSDAISRAEIAEKEAFSSNARPDEPLDAKEVDRLESRVRFLESELQAATLRCADERSNDVARALQQMAPAQSDDTYLVSIMSRELRAAEEAMAAAEGRCDQSEAARESLRSQTAQLLQQDAQEASVVQDVLRAEVQHLDGILMILASVCEAQLAKLAEAARAALEAEAAANDARGTLERSLLDREMGAVESAWSALQLRSALEQRLLSDAVGETCAEANAAKRQHAHEVRDLHAYQSDLKSELARVEARAVSAETAHAAQAGELALQRKAADAAALQRQGAEERAMRGEVRAAQLAAALADAEAALSSTRGEAAARERQLEAERVRIEEATAAAEAQSGARVAAAAKAAEQAQERARVHQALLKEAIARERAFYQRISELEALAGSGVCGADDADGGADQADDTADVEAECELLRGQNGRLERRLRERDAEIASRDASIAALTKRLEALAHHGTEAHMNDCAYWVERRKRKEFATARDEKRTLGVPAARLAANATKEQMEDATAEPFPRKAAQRTAPGTDNKSRGTGKASSKDEKNLSRKPATLPQIRLRAQ